MSYENFLLETEYPFCWYCGRQHGERIERWHSHLIIERSHIVSKPRIEDRRVAMLMCSYCHSATHRKISGYSLPLCTLANALWLKRAFDIGYYDVEFMQRFSVAKLPEPIEPPKIVQQEFQRRMGSYPK